MSEWSKEPDSSSGSASCAGSNPAARKISLYYLIIAAMPERSKGEVLRTSGHKRPRGFEPHWQHYRFHSVEVSTLDFDSNIPGSNPGGTKFFYYPILQCLKKLI